MTNRDKFLVATLRLSRQNTLVFKEFVVAYSAYVTELVEDAVKAPTETVLTANGKAQALLALREDFRKIETDPGAIEKISRPKA